MESQTKTIFDNIRDIRPLFILGVPRSGTTFLHQIINSHPNVFISDELREVAWLVKEARKIREGFRNHGNPYPFNMGSEFSDYLVGNAGVLIAPFYYLNAEKLGKKNLKYWGDKYPHFDEALPQMKKMFPRAKYIMIHRDLKDVMASVQTGHQWDTERTVDYVSTIYTRYIRHVKELSNDTIYHIHYDTLNLSPKENTKKIFDFLNLDYNDTLLEQIYKGTKIQSHSVRTGTDSPKDFDKNKASGKWKELYTDEDLNLINSKLTEMRETLEIAKKMYKPV